MLRMLQYISISPGLRNPPLIFCRFLHFLSSLSLRLFSKGTVKSCRNRRWFSLYFSKRLSSFSSSSLATCPLVFRFCSLPSLRILSYLLSYVSIFSLGNDRPSFPISSFRSSFIWYNSLASSPAQLLHASSVFFFRYRSK